MASFSERTLAFEFGEHSYICEVSNDKLRVIDKITLGLKFEGDGDEYARVHDTVHTAVSELFGDEAITQIFGDRPESVLDDLDVLAELNKCVTEFMGDRLNAISAAYAVSAL